MSTRPDLDAELKPMNDTHSLSRTLQGGLYLTVFLTGAAVMVIELIGTRIIAPFYGASLYVWSSLISVTMIALAVGYFAGGWLADRKTRIGLSLIIGLAGLATLAIPLIARPVLMATDSLGLRLGAFSSALLLFFPSLTFLGMVGPGAIKLSTSRLTTVGTSAGSIYAVSTVGSVIGTLLLGFFLFPLVGSRQVLSGLGIVLLLLSFAVAWYERKTRKGALTSVAVTVVIGIALVPLVIRAGIPYSGTKFNIRSEQESLYGWVRVIDNPSDNLRLLTSDASTIGAAYISRTEGRLGYQDVVNLIPKIRPHIDRALLIGLGAGHMANVLHNRYGVTTDTLEIDPAVEDAASQWFGFKPSGRNIVGDARYEIRRLTGPYDLIIHDCFTGGSEPSHLLSVETLRQLRTLLTEQGILVVNFVAFAEKGNNPALASVARTIAEAFPNYAVLISEPGEDFNDFILLASNSPIDLESKLLTASEASRLKERVFHVNVERGVLLTDDLNPLEHLQTRKAEHYRRVVADWLGTALLVR